MDAAARQDRFEEALDEATGIAALSPSSHNCQPWALARLAGGAREAARSHLGVDASGTHQYLVLALDRQRALGSLAAHEVEMQVSCGAYWRMLSRALAARGWEPTHTRTVTEGDGPDLGVDWPSAWSPLCVMAVAEAPSSGDSPADLWAAARSRRTNRGPYRPEPIDAALLRELARPPARGDAKRVAVRHVTAPAERKALASFVARHAGRDFKDDLAWRETHSFLRFDDGEAQAHGDGFTLTQLFGPMSRPRHAAMRLALSPAVMRLLCRLGFHRVLAVGLAAMVRRGPALVTMNFTAGTPDLADALQGGARLADYWLAAARAGLGLHPVSVVLQHDDLRRQVQRRLGLDGRPFFLSRLGRPLAEAPPSVRRGGASRYRTVGDSWAGQG
ncbi:nitroreductase family protein [Streptomyces sp. NBC_01283]|uniref:RedV protein n=1 Tax=Streptomyces sp. NBC_01283 TaxID=2903812 RepID=UPI00352D72BA|nr:nitroreductase family protein [Streptomyces sp. NBC_01283]